MKGIFTALIVMASCLCSAQELSYNKSVYSMNGMPGDFLVPELLISNTTASPVQVFVNRVQQNLPNNWFMCYCHQQCHPPSLDSLRFYLAPGETTTIGIGFTTDANIDGMGAVKIAVHAVGFSQKDTLDFSATTLMVGVNEHSAKNKLQLYPTLASDYLEISGNIAALEEIEITDGQGRIVQRFAADPALKRIAISELAQGQYYLNFRSSNNTITHKFIKQ